MAGTRGTLGGLGMVWYFGLEASNPGHLEPRSQSSSLIRLFEGVPGVSVEDRFRPVSARACTEELLCSSFVGGILCMHSVCLLYTWLAVKKCCGTQCQSIAST